MFCNKCGNKLNEGTVFCTNCGNKIVTEIPKEPVVNYQKPNKKSNKGLLVLFFIILAGFLVSLGFLFKNLFWSDSSNSSSSSNSSIVSNSTWTASDDSEMVFEDDRLYWYENYGKHDDNYFAGKYKFYIGKEAVDFITTDLKSYGVTKSELESLFERNSNYDEENFVVIDINYDKLIVDGKSETIPKPHIPLYGFILRNNTYLDVANMNTGTYYKFTKK